MIFVMEVGSFISRYRWSDYTISVLNARAHTHSRVLTLTDSYSAREHACRAFDKKRSPYACKVFRNLEAFGDSRFSTPLISHATFFYRGR